MTDTDLQQIRDALESSGRIATSHGLPRDYFDHALVALVRVGERIRELERLRDGAYAELARVEELRAAAEIAVHQLRTGRAYLDMRGALEASELRNAELESLVAKSAENADVRADAATKALRAIHTVAINGTVCTPPDTWSDPLFGGDGSGSMFDIAAMKCGECRHAWTLIDKVLADVGRSLPESAKEEVVDAAGGS